MVISSQKSCFGRFYELGARIIRLLLLLLLLYIPGIS